MRTLYLLNKPYLFIYIIRYINIKSNILCSSKVRIERSVEDAKVLILIQHYCNQTSIKCSMSRPDLQFTDAYCMIRKFNFRAGHELIFCPVTIALNY